MYNQCSSTRMTRHLNKVPFLSFPSFPFLKSWSKVQFWDKISTLTFSSPVDVVTEHFCVHDKFWHGIRVLKALFKTCIWASTNPVLASYTVPSLHPAFCTWSAFYTRSAVRVHSSQSSFYTDWPCIPQFMCSPKIKPNKNAMYRFY